MPKEKSNGVDAELECLGITAQALSALDDVEARERVIQYLIARYTRINEDDRENLD